MAFDYLKRKKILLVDDEPELLNMVTSILENEGYTNIKTALTAAGAIDACKNFKPELAVLDVMLPDGNGFDLLRELKKISDFPVLFLTARGEDEDKWKGFGSGADDYMVKPVNEEEMLLRIKALLRRSRIANEHRLHIGKVTLDYDALTVAREGISQTLPQKEFYLLYKLLSYPDKIFTRLQLMDEIWGMDSETVDTTVNVHVNRLRKRFEGWQEFEIIAIRGIGYKAVITNG